MPQTWLYGADKAGDPFRPQRGYQGAVFKEIDGRLPVRSIVMTDEQTGELFSTTSLGIRADVENFPGTHGIFFR